MKRGVSRYSNPLNRDSNSYAVGLWKISNFPLYIGFKIWKNSKLFFVLAVGPGKVAISPLIQRPRDLGSFEHSLYMWTVERGRIQSTIYKPVVLGISSSPPTYRLWDLKEFRTSPSNVDRRWAIEWSEGRVAFLFFYIVELVQKGSSYKVRQSWNQCSS